MDNKLEMQALEKDWETNPRWKQVLRPYHAEEVLSLRPSLMVEHTLAKYASERMWQSLQQDAPLTALGCLTGNQAIQAAQAGLKAIYCSGWQVAGDNNSSRQVYPDQSLYPVDSVPLLVEQINNALTRADEVNHLTNHADIDWYLPIIADAEAGFGGNLNAYELMKHMIRAGAAAVHFEDQLSSAKKCGHMGGKVLVPTREAMNKLVAARLAADVLGVPTILIARTDAQAANLLTSDIDERDQSFLTGKRTNEGFYYVKNGLDQAISRGVSYAPLADLIWCETAKPDLEEAKEFAQGIHEKYPGKMLAYNCSPSFNWQANLDDNQLKDFRYRLFELGYRFQFITLAGWHSLNTGMFELAKAYLKDGMYAYAKFQGKEFELEKEGFRAVKHQSFVGAGYFDAIQTIITRGESELGAMQGSTEEEQF
ncbi:isocitrate lyase [Legionella sp. W05-934-2]|jgi:isocitrate lyase|uniref:isocitrate lyase n=1 Tax=Legionella sp. W05-934-2 TaxID=1198649 RepID=UPI003463143F